MFLGYPMNINSADQFSFEDHTQKSVTDTFNENIPIEVISDDTIFVFPNSDINKETTDEEFQARIYFHELLLQIVKAVTMCHQNF